MNQSSNSASTRRRANLGKRGRLRVSVVGASPLPDSDRRNRFRRQVLGWYRSQKRDLPWRRDRNPYRIWVSEIMLQQTQVKTVLRYYERFLARFPDLQSLAVADEDEVVAHWSGLGYYSRARSLHRAARTICQQSGQFPTEYQQILQLPGVGRYTAGAISSIAFGSRHPVVDGNVRRLFTRYFGGDLSEPECWRLAERLLPSRQTGEYNQAVMEIGATVCRPNRPQCLLCPLETGCQSRGGVAPPTRKSVAAPAYNMVLLVLRNGSKFWLEKRDKSERLLKHLWSFPLEYGRAPVEDLQLRLLQRYGLSNATPAGTCRHTITRYRFRVFVLTACTRRRPRSVGGWLQHGELEQFPRSSLVDKALKASG